MGSFTAADFIGADITVKRVLFCEHAISTTWARPNKFPRDCEGLLCFLSGEIEYYFDGYTFVASPGQVFKLPSGIPYYGKKLDTAPLEVYRIDFEADPGTFADFPIPDSFYPSGSLDFISKFENIIKLYQNNTICSALECKNALSAFLCELAKDHAVNVCRYDDRSRILSICEYIKENSRDSGFRITDAAEKFHISDAHLRRIFANELHTSPLAYLTNTRIDAAKKYLVGHPDMSISEIADECGYSSVYYFSSAFRCSVGMTPTKYRDSMLDMMHTT